MVHINCSGGVTEPTRIRSSLHGVCRGAEGSRKYKSRVHSIFPDVVNMTKFYHDSQPEARLKSTRADERDEDGLSLICELKDTYEDYRNLINKSKSTRTSDAGKKWLDIISTRLKWLAEDEVAIMEKIKDCEREKGPLL